MLIAFRKRWPDFRIAFWMIALALLFPMIASMLNQNETTWLQRIGVLLGIISYFGSFLLLSAGVVMAVIATGVAIYQGIKA